MWKEQFGNDYLIPAEILELVKKGLAKDLSWKNDASPSFGKSLDSVDSGSDIRIWVEHPNADKREFCDMNRFCVCMCNEGGSFDGLDDTDDVQEAIKMYLNLIEKYKDRIVSEELILS